MVHFMSNVILICCVALLSPNCILSVLGFEKNVDHAPEVHQARAGVHLNRDLLDANIQMVFLGTINNKRYYLENATLVDQDTARANCVQFGMALARFSSQAELDFVASKIGSNGSAWTDAQSNRNLTSLVYRGECVSDQCTPLKDGQFKTGWYDSVGALIYNSGIFAIISSTESHPYICFV